MPHRSIIVGLQTCGGVGGFGGSSLGLDLARGNSIAMSPGEKASVHRHGNATNHLGTYCQLLHFVFAKCELCCSKLALLHPGAGWSELHGAGVGGAGRKHSHLPRAGYALLRAAPPRPQEQGAPPPLRPPRARPSPPVTSAAGTQSMARDVREGHQLAGGGRRAVGAGGGASASSLSHLFGAHASPKGLLCGDTAGQSSGSPHTSLFWR